MGQADCFPLIQYGAWEWTEPASSERKEQEVGLGEQQEQVDDTLSLDSQPSPAEGVSLRKAWFE